MGDMADYHLDYSDKIYDEYDECDDEPFGINCKYCKRGPYFWCQMLDDGRWRLVTKTGKVHVCKAYRIQVS